MLLADTQLVQRIEQSCARSLAAIMAACAGDSFAVPLSSGFALFHGEGSPLTKVAGIGFEPFALSELAQLEQRYHERRAVVQIELATHADPELSNRLIERGYRFAGFEHVLGRALDDAATPCTNPGLVVRRARRDELDAWIAVLAEAASQLAGDEQHAAHDQFERSALERVYRDMGQTAGIDGWLALREGTIVGGATASTQHGGVAELLGAGTLVAQRRRGVQGALLAARLAAARESGCDVAVVVTQPGSQSQRNVQRAGFALLYARAVWQLQPR